jgi:hypothetical protein
MSLPENYRISVLIISNHLSPMCYLHLSKEISLESPRLNLILRNVRYNQAR